MRDTPTTPNVLDLIRRLKTFLNEHVWGLAGCATAAWVLYMLPAAPASSRTPPAWGPEMEARYSFQDWSRDIMVWSILNADLDSRRKCAAVTLQLRGGAQDMVRGLPPQAMMASGIINGVVVDPMTFLMHALSERYAQLGEETRLEAVTELIFVWKAWKRADRRADYTIRHSPPQSQSRGTIGAPHYSTGVAAPPCMWSE